MRTQYISICNNQLIMFIFKLILSVDLLIKFKLNLYVRFWYGIEIRSLSDKKTIFYNA